MDLLTLLSVADDIGWFVAPVTGWLIVAGDRGATTEDLVKAIGDESEVVDALAMLKSHGCVDQIDTENNRFRLNICNCEKRVQAFTVEGSSILPSIPKGKIETSPKMKKIKRTGNVTRKAKQKGRLPRKSSSVRPVKVKKIRKTGVGALRDMVDEDNARTYRNVGGGSRYIDTPSKYPALNLWRSKGNPNHWKALDWIGYWLHLWFEYYDQEDPIFAGQRCHGVSSEPDIYLEHGFKAVQLRDSSRGFRGDGAGLKEFLDWVFSDFLPDATWLDDPIMARQIFRVRNNSFLDKFRVRSVKVKGKSSKPRGKWNPWGYSDR